jgi:hypothetical protein
VDAVFGRGGAAVEENELLAEEAVDRGQGEVGEGFAEDAVEAAAVVVGAAAERGYMPPPTVM